jgi:serralysin
MWFRELSFMAKIYALIAAVGLWSLLAGPAEAFLANGHWDSTAMDGMTGPVGTPITLTWSIVPDGTPIPGYNASNLVSSFDSLFGVSGGSDLTTRTWFSLIQQSFDRWESLGGITFVYQPADDGATLGNAAGDLTKRGDVRIGGTYIDGGGGTYGQTGYVPYADITLDTGDSLHWTIASLSHRSFRDTVMHEIGHSFGLGHTDSNSAAFLMEPFFSSGYDGPQLDDIRGIQNQYGDVYEKAFDGAGNGTIDTATDLGPIAAGASVTLGADAATGTVVLSGETDFVSIANHNDYDFFSFTTTSPSALDLVLTPVGASYNERFDTGPYTTVVSSAISDLTLQLYGMDGGEPDLLAQSNVNPAGQAESILGFELPATGEYYVRVSGNADTVQMYEISVGVEALIIALPGDYNQNGVIDAADYSVWRDTLASGGTSLPNDATPGTVDQDDFLYWRDHFGDSSGGGSGALASAPVPEPGSLGLLAAGSLGCLVLGRRDHNV